MLDERTVDVIAEIGTGHNGSIERAYRLIDMASRCGADYAKFQYVLADEIVHPNTGLVHLPGGDIPLYERFRELEQPPEFYGRLKEHCESVGIAFLCTPYGITSAKVLRDLGCERLKIASPELNHLELLSEVSEYGLPIYLSTGVSRLSDIETALEALVSNEVTVLHCVTAYPAPPSEYNLRVLASLAAVFGVKVGVSDHSLDPRLVSTLAVSQGARAVEKHITLSRSDPGLDDPIAQDEDGFQSCVDSIRQAETETPEDTLARVADEFGEDLVQEVLGDGVKRVAPAEAQNYGRTNRSLHVVRDIPAGHVLCRADFQAFRTEKKLRPGLPPEYAQKIVGCRTTVAIPAGEGLRFEDLVNRPATDYSLGVST